MISFKPNGNLNISTEPTDLPHSVDKNGGIHSEALTRCKNLRIDQKGKVTTRDGSAKINASAIETPIYLLVEQVGTRYAFAGTQIYENESSIATGLTDAQWSAVKYSAFNETSENVYAVNGTDRKRINGSNVYEWGIVPPDIDPLLASGFVAGLTGDYNAKYSFVRKSGSLVLSESNLSSAGTAATLSDNSLRVVCFGSTDTQVTHIRLYRTSTNGLLYNVDQDYTCPDNADYAITADWEADEVSSNTTYQITTYSGSIAANYIFSWETDTTDGDLKQETSAGCFYHEPCIFDTDTADADLGNEEATNHTRPPLATFVFGPAYNGTLFAIVDNNLHYCLPKQPEYWPGVYFIEVSNINEPGISGVLHNGQAHFLTKNEIYYIQGTRHGTFFPIPMRAKTGAQGPMGAVSVRGQGIYHTGPDGIYLYSNDDKRITEETLEPIFRGETVNGIPAVSDMTKAWLYVHRNKLYFGYVASGETYPVNVLVFNLETARTSHYVYNDGSDVEISTIVEDKENKRLLIGDYTGYVREIEKTSATDDSGTDITWDLQSMEYTLQTRRHFPRWVKYDVDASSATTATGSLILDGSVHQTHTLSSDRDTNRRLVKGGNGRRCQLRINGTGTVTVYASEME